MGEENNGWNRGAQNGKGQGLKAKNEDANVLGGGGKGNELRNPGGEGEQSKESGGAERKRPRNKSHEGGSERAVAKEQGAKTRYPKAVRGEGGISYLFRPEELTSGDASIRGGNWRAQTGKILYLFCFLFPLSAL